MQEYHFFVAHEFSTQQRDDLRDAIERAFKGTGLNPYYADMEVREGQTHILHKVKEMILKTHFGIYDITNTQKPNVFLELGIAMAADKPLYIICEKGTQIPADVHGLDRIEYTSYKNLTGEIKKKIIKKEKERLAQINKTIQSQTLYKEVLDHEVRQKAIRIYQAEELRHRFGYQVEDETASNGKAWFALLSQGGHVVYGPYEELAGLGKYEAFFRMKMDHNYYSTEAVLSIEVSMGVVWGGPVYAIEFRKPNVYQLFGVEFEYPGTGLLEFRVYNLAKRGKIWIDYIAIVRLSEGDKECNNKKEAK